MTTKNNDDMVVVTIVPEENNSEIERMSLRGGLHLLVKSLWLGQLFLRAFDKRAVYRIHERVADVLGVALTNFPENQFS